MWVQVQVQVDPIAGQRLKGTGDAVYVTDGEPGLNTQAWVKSETLPPDPQFEKGTLVSPVRDFKLARLVVWPDPAGTECVTLFGAWTHEPGGLIADKWAEGDVT